MIVSSSNIALSANNLKFLKGHQKFSIFRNEDTEIVHNIIHQDI